MPKKMRALFLAPLLALGLAVGAAAPASAAGPWDGTDPQNTGCAANALTRWSTTLVDPRTGAAVGTMEVRWSRTCQTNWVRVDNWIPGAQVHMSIDRVGGPYGSASGSLTESYTGTVWSNQVYAPGTTCVHVGTQITKGGQHVGSSGQSPAIVC